ncbi:DHA2 family efflux MFS transporter permease subunit [Streptomyces sp. NBC_01775]|uniref:MFS transporter n=1 Tax=Streptomyces sp. NBC_01775 TaxID=2975939 RepID=UPI002DDC1E43|nr:MFS transporter [Streptomyces sp. NBC_01775]WSB77260.1 DHA2 family efflux MFS transporter permease subunit [Streptomyces sp. NBC_01775]
MSSSPPSSGRGSGAWAVVLASSIGQFLVVLDVSVVNVALPSMRDGLSLSGSALQWVVNAYALTFAGFLLLGGRAADLFGRKPVYLAGLGLFTAASLAGGLAQDAEMLIVARAVQGIGAAVLAPVTLSLLTSTFPEGPARTRAIATWAAVGTAGGAAGGLVGGLLTDLLSWRWVLLINVPVGVLVVAVVVLGLRERHEKTGRRGLDLPGAALVTSGVAALAYGIGRTESHSWGSAQVLVPLVGGLLALAAFVAVEARTAEPLVPLRLFRLRAVAAGNVVTFVAMTGAFAMWYFLSLYMQNVLGYSAVRAGVSFLPHTAGVIVGSKAAPRLMARFGIRAMVAVGGVVATAGFGWQGLVLNADGTFLGTILGPGILMAGGIGLLMTPLTDAATTGAAAREAGVVAGLVNTSRQIGGALGLAVLGAVAVGATAAQGAEPTEEQLADGYAAAYLVAAALTAASVLLVGLLPRTGGTRQARTGAPPEVPPEVPPEAPPEVPAEAPSAAADAVINTAG